MALLEVENLSHAFSEKQLYKDSSFELYKGEQTKVTLNGKTIQQLEVWTNMQ